MPGIETLYIFGVYQTREAYKQATGAEAPEWNPALPIKSWRDEYPPTPDEDGNVEYLVLAIGADKKTPAVGSDGKPYLRKMRISATQAMRVNIPPKDFARDARVVDPGSLSPTASIEVPVPCKLPAADEELFFAWGGRAEVRKRVQTPVQAGGSSTDLQRVEAKLDANAQLLLEALAKIDVLLATSRQ